MILSRIDLAAERWELAKLVAAILQPALMIALAVGLMLASAHLITMLGTRWGRRRVSQKALVFSVVVHFSLVCGILALWPEAATRSYGTLSAKPVRPPEPPPEAFTVVAVPDNGSAESNVNNAANQAVWNRLPDDLTQEPERTAAEPAPFEEIEDSRPETVAPPETEIAIVAPLPTPDQELPAPVDPTDEESIPPVAVVETATLRPSPVPELRDEAQPPSAPRARTAAAPDSLPETSATDAAQRPEAAPIERLAPLPNVDEPTTSVAGDFDEQATLRQADEGVDIVKPEGPAPAELPTPTAAPAIASSGSPAAEEAPLRPSVPRGRTTAPTRAPTADTDDVERVRPVVPPDRKPRGETRFPAAGLARTETPSVETPQIGVPDASPDASVPAPYRLRATEERQAATREFGGNTQSERAVELSLQWLADNQTNGGYWDASEHGAGSTRVEDKSFRDVGKEADTGVTGLAVLAFLGPVEGLGDGRYAKNVERALRWLVLQQRGDGGMGGLAGATDYAYCHAMATFALAEAFALSDAEDQQWLRGPVERAIQFTIDSMTDDGGWRYQKGNEEGDMSVFGWQLMALKSAELGGIAIPKTVNDKMVRFLIARSLGANGGLAGYRPRERPSAPMTAEALYCKQRLGISRENPACIEAVAFLLKSPPQRTAMNYYYWYYGSLAMRHHGGEEWDQWNESLRDLLVQEQNQDGLLAGSWDPNDVWGRYGGRIYSTALATLCLEVYYRYGNTE